jgi:NOL1/NOP2/fmu family ribosome biogenesis protein
MTGEHNGQQFDRLAPTAEDREREGRPTRTEVLDWWDERFGIDPSVFDGVTFWEKGKGKIWVFQGDVESPVRVEGLGMSMLRTRGEHWKPTTDAVQRFGHHATENVIHLSRPEAEAFVAGHDQELEWDGDWGYLIVTHDFVGEAEPLGVGLYLHGELRSQIPKGRQRDL